MYLKDFIMVCVKFGNDCFFENQLMLCGQKSAKRSILLTTSEFTDFSLFFKFSMQKLAVTTIFHWWCS